MKKLVLILIVLLTSLLTLVSANIYQQDSLILNLNVNGKINLVKEDSSATLKEVSTELLIYPIENYRQEIVNLDTDGEIKNNKISFFWDDGIIEEKLFGYNAVIQTKNQRNKVKTKVLFPIENVPPDIEEYLYPTETIDSNNKDVVNKASELAEGEDDLFKVVFNLANWVEENVEYDLTTLTAETSQKASWVLENRNGVCDEMTSLFIAMARSLGIPARFVSGVSYSTSELFPEPWQNHGWGEVYFPEVGWVSFDITFGEYGYIDVTHIKLREDLDPADPATKYNWLATKVDLETSQLNIETEIDSYGEEFQEELIIEQEILANEVDFGSFNLIKGIVKNKGDYYQATTLQLAAPKDLEIVGKNKRTVMLHPKEIRETYWIVKVSDNLNNKYWYTYPTVIYSEKNVSAEDYFQAVSGKNYYSKQEIDKLTVENEEKSYSRKVAFDCNYPDKISLDEEKEFKCNIKNVGNINLNNVEFCLGGVCKIISELPINQEENTKITVKGDKAGWEKVFVTAKNSLIDKRISLEYQVIDSPKIEIKTTVPEIVTFPETFKVEINVKKSSFQNPKNIEITLKGPTFENIWTLEELKDEESLVLEVSSEKFSKKNKLLVNTVWKDNSGNSFKDNKELIVNVTPSSFKDKIIMLINSILKIFYQ
jgi:hypothetical protein